VLSPTTIRAVRQCLVDVDTRAQQTAPSRLRRQPLLLVLLDKPADTAPGSASKRQVQVLSLPGASARVLAADAPLPQVLHAVAHAIHTDYVARLGPVRAYRRAVWARDHDVRLLACAVLYHDVSISPDEVRPVRRIDAADSDARTYQLTRHPGSAEATVTVTEPGHADQPMATQPALTALVTVLTAAIAPRGSRR
jgi:hypothetical protein